MDGSTLGSPVLHYLLESAQVTSSGSAGLSKSIEKAGLASKQVLWPWTDYLTSPSLCLLISKTPLSHGARVPMKRAINAKLFEKGSANGSGTCCHCAWETGRTDCGAGRRGARSTNYWPRQSLLQNRVSPTPPPLSQKKRSRGKEESSQSHGLNVTSSASG